MATLKNTTINDTGHLTLPVGTTAQRPASPVVGMLRYNTSLGFSEQYNADGWQGIAPPPVITTISPSNFNGESGTSITINGSNFDSTSTVQFILTGGAVVNATTTTRVSTNQLTATTPRDFLASESPASVKVTNGSGLAATLENALSFAAVPVFTSTSGSIGQIYDGSRSSLGHLSTLAATDADGGFIDLYTIVSGSLPAGLTLNSSTAALSGAANAVGSDTTSTFTIRARDNAGNTTDRSFSITVRAPVVQSFTSTGTTTFSVPTGVSNARVVVVAGGGAGGTRNAGFNGAGTDGGAGAGAGGMIDHPAFPLTPGGSVSVTVGAGAAANFSTTQIAGNNGSNSVFSTLTAIGGGGGGAGPGGPVADGIPGGSGGGRGGGGSATGPTGTGTQPSQSGASGTFGFGFPGGNNTNLSLYTGAGGGGASAAGNPGGSGVTGNGGAGRATTVSGSSVTYGGGGGGASGSGINNPGAGGVGGGGPGNNYRTNGNPGSTNTGGGGGGGPGGAGGDNAGAGGGGGPGIVIIRF